MKKIIFLLSAFFLVSCSNTNKISNNKAENDGEKHDGNYKTEVLKKLIYSNVADKETQEKISEALKNGGVSEKNINLFLKSVRLFNEAVEGKELIQKGFITSENIKPEYNKEVLNTLWEKKYPHFPGYNCRITTYSLMREFLVSNISETVDSEILFLDMEALDTDTLKLFDKGEKEIFKTVFSSIDTENSKDVNVHFEKIKQEWSKRGVKFKNNDKISMISVFFHSQLTPQENILFIGHVGVLVKLEDKNIMFIEKLAFHEPYQAIKFENKEQVKEYILNRYDVEWDQPTARPFIVENDRLM